MVAAREANDDALYLALKNDVLISCFKLFEVYHEDAAHIRGVSREYHRSAGDEWLTDTLLHALDAFDPKRGDFVNFVLFKYGKTIMTEGCREDGRTKALDYPDGPISSAEDEGADAGWNAVKPAEEARNALEADIEKAAELARMAEAPDDYTVREEALIVELLSLLLAFQDHKPDKRDHTDKQKLYRRLFFTESTTRSVKERPNVYECEPFARHERDVFRAMELPFLDGYMVDTCRSIIALWKSDLKEGFGQIIPDDRFEKHDQLRRTRAVWTLEADYYIAYIRKAGFGEVGRSGISEQRKKFKMISGQLAASHSQTS